MLTFKSATILLIILRMTVDIVIMCSYICIKRYIKKKLERKRKNEL